MPDDGTLTASHSGGDALTQSHPVKTAIRAFCFASRYSRRGRASRKPRGRNRASYTRKQSATLVRRWLSGNRYYPPAAYTNPRRHTICLHIDAERPCVRVLGCGVSGCGGRSGRYQPLQIRKTQAVVAVLLPSGAAVRAAAVLPPTAGPARTAAAAGLRVAPGLRSAAAGAASAADVWAGGILRPTAGPARTAAAGLRAATAPRWAATDSTDRSAIGVPSSKSIAGRRAPRVRLLGAAPVRTVSR